MSLLTEVIAAWDGLLDLPETLIATAPSPEARRAVERMVEAIDAARASCCGFHSAKCDDLEEACCMSCRTWTTPDRDGRVPLSGSPQGSTDG